MPDLSFEIEECDIDGLKQGDHISLTLTVPRVFSASDAYKIAIVNKSTGVVAATGSSTNVGVNVDGFSDEFESSFERYNYARAVQVSGAISSTIGRIDLTITIPPPVSSRLSGRYRYEIQAQPTNGQFTTLVNGTMKFDADIAKNSLFA